MPRIERLSDELVDKIAAGEVVERPASVVKELIENALDAGARSVTVEIEEGGRKLIRVRDDGHGLGADDARLAVERHATSKLRGLADLAAIATHGFRGEALASIGSVSELSLTTREERAVAGTRVEVRAGAAPSVREAGHPRGTSVEVRDLFGAVPARRKFLRADSTEAAHVAEVVTLFALAHPEVGFRLSGGGRALVEVAPVGDLAARIYELFGPEHLDRLLAFEGGRDWLTARGLLSKPGRPGPARALVRLFVNGRPVRDRAVLKAIGDGYRAAGVSDPRPEGVVFLEAPLHLVDVNVHPAKSEVRFADPRFVFAAVESAVREGLGRAARGGGARAATDRVREAAEGYLARHEPAEANGAATPRASLRGAWAPEAAPGGGAPAAAGAPAGSLGQPGPLVLGQHRHTYIVATDGEELLLVDQHTAHERVRYEALVERLGRRAAESQGLLAPAVVRLAPRLRPTLEANAEALTEVGFDVESFGGDSLRVRAVPALLAGRDPGPALTDLLSDLLERGSTSFIVSGERQRLAATLACHSAARAGQALGLEQMRAIVADLARTAQPGLCPHGRPTHVRIPREDVSRWFGRTGWRRQ